MSYWQTTRFRIELDRPLVMGIVNVTPDSFSDGGLHCEAGAAIAHCEQLLSEGADLLDIGGESSRPGAPTLSPDEEWQRIAPVLKAALSLGLPVSVDTCKPGTMQRALDLGVDIVNDIQALQLPGAAELVAAHPNCGMCLMHMRGDPISMQGLTRYGEITREVGEFLAARTAHMRQLGVAAERILIDPGYGFAKTAEQNFQLLREQSALLVLGYPLLVGWSRKSSLGAVTGRPVEQRLAGSLAAALAAVAQGAQVLRVHDVAPTVDALKVWAAAGGSSGPVMGENQAIQISGGRSR